MLVDEGLHGDIIKVAVTLHTCQQLAVGCHNISSHNIFLPRSSVNYDYRLKSILLNKSAFFVVKTFINSCATYVNERKLK